MSKLKNKILAYTFLPMLAICAFSCLGQKSAYAEESTTSYENYICDSAIGDQNAVSTTSNLCWAFSGTKVIESFLYNQTHEKNTVNNASLWKNFSESWISLAYMYYVNDSANSSKLIAGQGKYDDNTSYVYNRTGNVYYLQRAVNAYGLTYESDCPQDISVDNSNYTTVFDSYKNYADKNIAKNIVFKSIVEYGDVGYVNSDKTKEFNEVLTRMKDYLKNYGALSTNVDISCLNTSGSDNYIYYANTQNTTNHALTIIGYDNEKAFTINNNKYQGAFKALNSTGTTNKYIWIPYEMYRPAIVKNSDNENVESNNVLSNTYYIYSLQYGNNVVTANTYVMTQSSFFENLINALGENAGIKFFALCCAIIFLVTVLIILICALLRKKKTDAINKSAMIKCYSNYHIQQTELERQKQELEAEVEENRQKNYKKKQRRLKIQFQKNLEEQKKKDDSTLDN